MVIWQMLDCFLLTLCEQLSQPQRSEESVHFFGKVLGSSRCESLPSIKMF